MLNTHLVAYPTPMNLNYSWNGGSLAGLMLVSQMLTGILLAMHYVGHVDHAFDSVQRLMTDVPSGMILRYAHANGASLFFVVVYLHVLRGLYYGSGTQPREMVWITGVAILLLMIITAFIGYVLPWGQMSFWGATVITSLATAIPEVGKPILYWLWGGFSVDNPTLSRFYSLHYTLPFVLAGLSVFHIAALHQYGSTNPLGVNSQSSTLAFGTYFGAKDLLGALYLALLFSILVFFYPDLLGHPDNFTPANPYSTPVHIVPEWYFLWVYAILRSIPNKAMGVLAIGLVFASLFALPFIGLGGGKFRPLTELLFWGAAADALLLTSLGGQEITETTTFVGQCCSGFLFFYLLLCLPVIGWLETRLLSGEALPKGSATGTNASTNSQTPSPQGNGRLGIVERLVRFILYLWALQIKILNKAYFILDKPYGFVPVLLFLFGLGGLLYIAVSLYGIFSVTAVLLLVCTVYAWTCFIVVLIKRHFAIAQRVFVFVAQPLLDMRKFIQRVRGKVIAGLVRVLQFPFGIVILLFCLYWLCLLHVTAVTRNGTLSVVSLFFGSMVFSFALSFTEAFMQHYKLEPSLRALLQPLSKKVAAFYDFLVTAWTGVSRRGGSSGPHNVGPFGRRDGARRHVGRGFFKEVFWSQVENQVQVVTDASKKAADLAGPVSAVKLEPLVGGVEAPTSAVGGGEASTSAVAPEIQKVLDAEKKSAESYTVAERLKDGDKWRENTANNAMNDTYNAGKVGVAVGVICVGEGTARAVLEIDPQNPYAIAVVGAAEAARHLEIQKLIDIGVSGVKHVVEPIVRYLMVDGVPGPAAVDVPSVPGPAAVDVPTVTGPVDAGTQPAAPAASDSRL